MFPLCRRPARNAAERAESAQRIHKIPVMHKRHVREIGTHQELLDQRGIC
jgi:ABC-type multidrug transport system fused ATPase/permease subunit